MTIGTLARLAKTKVQTIRYYEKIGLLPEAPRSPGGQRRYDTAALERLRFIRHGRDLGFSLDAIRELIALSDRPDTSCEEADRIARRHLGAVRGRLERLRALETELERMVAQCAGGTVSDCRVIEVLHDHAHCLHPRH